MYDPIYSSNVGLCGFRCRCKFPDGKACRKVVPTYAGIQMHCKRVHGLVAQMEMSYGETKTTAAGANDEPVRVISGCFGGGAKAATVDVSGKPEAGETVLFVDREVYRDPRDKS